MPSTFSHPVTLEAVEAPVEDAAEELPDEEAPEEVPVLPAGACPTRAPLAPKV